MSTTAVTIGWLAAAIGASLLLADAPWFRRSGLLERLAPYSRHRAARPRVGTADSFRQVMVPGLERWGSTVSRALGVRQDLATRLERAGMSIDPATFRVRQATRCLVSLLLCAATVLALRPTAPLAIAAVLGVPLLVLLAEEHRVSSAVERRRTRARAELPVVAEQLGLLLSAGYSLPSAISRLATRSDGVVAIDLGRVSRRVRQGLSVSEALTEWADRSGIDAIERLVAVLRLHDDAGDLGALISEEARTIRAAAHRDLLEVIERRSQLVWVPVTVATLVPGLIFLAVPFMSAMAQVTGGG